MDGTAFDTIWWAACEGVMLGLSVGYAVLAIMHRLEARFEIEPRSASTMRLDRTKRETLDRSQMEAFRSEGAVPRDLPECYGLLNLEKYAQQGLDELRLLSHDPDACDAMARRMM